MSPAGFPHSEICGSQPICGSPQLIAAYHVLHRLLTPRHPPCALSSLTEHLVLDVSPYPSSSIQLSKIAKTHGSVCDRAVRKIALSLRGPLQAADPYLVEIAGIEPATSGLQSRRSPN